MSRRFDKATAELGPLDVAVNNAGIEQPTTATVDDSGSPVTWDDQVTDEEYGARRA